MKTCLDTDKGKKPPLKKSWCLPCRARPREAGKWRWHESGNKRSFTKNLTLQFRLHDSWCISKCWSFVTYLFRLYSIRRQIIRSSKARISRTSSRTRHEILGLLLSWNSHKVSASSVIFSFACFWRDWLRFSRMARWNTWKLGGCLDIVWLAGLPASLRVTRWITTLSSVK